MQSLDVRWGAALAASIAIVGCSAEGGRADRDAGSGDRRSDARTARRDSAIPSGCSFNGDDDDDADGFTEADGDCNDCSPQVNPAGYDFPGNGFDEDCAEGDAAAVETCDDGLAPGSTDPRDGARAIGLCRTAGDQDRRWGVISARYVTADGAAPIPDHSQHGLLSSFGAAEPPQGRAMLALSTGAARAPGQGGYTAECDVFTGVADAPPGFPYESPACPGVITGEPWDPAALELRIRVPSNARGFSFNSIFYTYEYPIFICDEFNDFFVTLMDPAPAGALAGNIVFDDDDNLVSVNSSLFSVCSPKTVREREFTCPRGTALLADTGFDGRGECPNPDAEAGGSTGWLRTQAPVQPGSVITLRFTIWDSGDGNLDSLVLIDGFEWHVEAPRVIETVPDLI